MPLPGTSGFLTISLANAEKYASVEQRDGAAAPGSGTIGDGEGPKDEDFAG